MKVIATVLNVRSGPGTAFQGTAKLAKGTAVTVLETSGDWALVKAGTDCPGWVYRAYLAPEKPVIALLQPPIPARVRDVFGPPCSPDANSGRVDLPAPVRAGYESASISRIACHKLMVPVFKEVFARIYGAGLWDLIKTYDGIFNCRPIKGTDVYSFHSWGIAIDLNAATNQPRTKGDMPKELVKIFTDLGFFWGGNFSETRRDPMHTEFVKRS